MRFIDRVYILAIGSLLLLSGCSDPEVEYISQPYSPEVAARLARNQAIASALNRDYKESYVSSLYRSFGVGYGYCAFEGYADYGAVRDLVVNLDSLLYYAELEGCLCLTDDRSPRAYQHVMTGEESEKLLKALSVNAGLSADLNFFQAEVKGSYASSDLRSNYYSFCTIHTGMVLGSRHLDPLTLATLCRKHPTIVAPELRYLVSEVEAAITDNNLSLAVELVDIIYSIYGSHLLYHADLGGRLTFLSTFERASLDSRTSLSTSARAKLLAVMDYSVSEGEENTLKQTASTSKSRITAIGGDVTIISQMLFDDATGEAGNTIGAGIVEEWYKSVRLDFESVKENNSELIEIKLYPLDEFISALGNEVVAQFLLQRIGRQMEYEDALFPRVYEQKNVMIPTDALWQPSTTQMHTVYSDNEVIGELDYECIHGREFVTCYPTIGGTVCHEGVARVYGSDSLYLVTWHDTIPYLMSLCPVWEVPYLYYSNGNLDIVPDSTRTYSVGDVKPLSTYMWTSTANAALKVGPYTLIQGAYASMGSQSYSNYATVISDLPVGNAEVTFNDMEMILQCIRQNYTRCPDMLRGKQWLLRQDGELRPTVAYTIGDDLKLHKVDDAYFGFILCRRVDGFRYP